MTNTSRLATGTLTTEQRNTWHTASRQLRAAGFQIQSGQFNGTRALVASKLRAGLTIRLALRANTTTDPLITLATWTFGIGDAGSYFSLDQATEAIATAIQTAEERT